MNPPCLSRSAYPNRLLILLPSLLCPLGLLPDPVALAATPSSGPSSLAWSESAGVTWHTPWAQWKIDCDGERRGPVLRFLKTGTEFVLDQPIIQLRGPDLMKLTYELSDPDAARVLVTRHLRVERRKADWALVETFVIEPVLPVAQELEIVRPFSVSSLLPGGANAEGLGCVLPLKNGWARNLTLSNHPAAAEYRLGHWIGGNDTPELALPLVQLDPNGGWQGSVSADPRFAALFKITAGPGMRPPFRFAGSPNEVGGEVRYRYAGSNVPLAGIESRSFGFWVRGAPPSKEPFGKSVDAFFRLMLSDVPAGPDWLHRIYMVDYDFLSDGGQGWEKDVGCLARWLKSRERGHVALCLHGWYDALGTYSFDETTGRLQDRWTAMARTRKVSFTPDELRRRLRFARSQGFRVLLYFGDGLAADSGVPGYHEDWCYVDEQGKKISGWQGPDTFGATFMMNPAHPAVRRHFLRYLDALLASVGRDVDGFVWDETFHARAGQIASNPTPAYCDRAMLDLVKALTARVRAFDSQKVFLASDCVGIMPNIPGYAMVASGLYQDSHCNPERWPDALFPNWRNVYWSCNWGPMSHSHWTRFGVEEFGAPVAISNGWGDDHGPHEWSDSERDDTLKLFRQRLARGPAHVRYLAEDPATILEQRSPDHAPAPSDVVPQPGPMEINWALAQNGSHATASSEQQSQDRFYPASGAIDGRGGDAGWGRGHGWASAAGAALPQWLQVEFPERRPVSRFMITTYQAHGDSARRWGVMDYIIEVWDEPSGQWKAVVREAHGRILFTRVHLLPRPVSTKKFRVLVTRVAVPAGAVARLLQVEAWGSSGIKQISE
jgi:hypothetical protein